MKKIIFILFIVNCYCNLLAQNIQLESPLVIIRNDNSADSYTLSYSIRNHASTETYKFIIWDKLEGTAKQGVDYQLAENPYDRGTAATFNNVESRTITLLAIEPCNILDKTIILHFKAIPQTPGEATINDTFTLIIHRLDKLTSDQKKDCRESARQRGLVWPENYGGVNIKKDTTNIPRTEFISYTDFKGFDPDQPNGLAQTQFLFKWPIIKEWAINNPNFKMQFLRSFLFPNMLFNRIDKTNDVLLYKPKFDTIKNSAGTGDSLYLLKSRNVNSFDIIKYSNFVLNGKLILISFKFQNSRLYLEWNATLYRMRVDSSRIATTFDPVYAISNGPQLFFETGNFGKSDEFSLRTTLSVEKIRILSNSFSQVDGISTINNAVSETNPKVAEDIEVKKSTAIWNLSARLSRSVSKDDKSLIFFKYSLFEQRLKNQNAGNESLKKSYNFFSQFQVGFSLTMDVFGKQ